MVDDGRANRELVQLILSDYGIDVVEAENGRIALERAAETAFDLILMDVHMPIMDGRTATEKLVKSGLTTPIVALTADVMDGFEESLLQSGFAGYQSKPIVIDELLKLVAKFLGGKQIDGDAKTQPLAAAPTSEPAAAEPLFSQLPNDPRFVSIVHEFVGELPAQLNALTDAFDDKNFALLASKAHWLKGGGGTVGFPAFTEPASELEKLAKAGNEAGMNELLANLKHIAARIHAAYGDANCEPSLERATA
ncbi:MAG: response regulator [Pseudomonadota bacterium]